MSNVWDSLPNAKHIDFVLEHIKQNTDKWNTATTAAERNIEWIDAWDVSRVEINNKGRESKWYKCAKKLLMITAAPGWASLDNTLNALFAYDDCAHLLYSDPKEVELLAKLGAPAAILLLPACIAISSCNAKQIAV
jgi:hypothetical protein